MKSRRLTCITAMIVFVALAIPLQLTAQHTRYTLTDLGTLGGTFSLAGGLNNRGDVKFRWDIINVDFAAGSLSAGGHASACANNNEKIKVTGSGTFVVGEREEMTGGGTWETFDSTSTCTATLPATGNGTSTGSGTYRVTRLVRFVLAPGTPPLPIDLITGTTADNRAGLLVLQIKYSDGSKGILVVSCHLVGTPDSVFEGVTATKGFVDYWNREAPPAPPAPFGDANRTTFHLLGEDVDD